MSDNTALTITEQKFSQAEAFKALFQTGQTIIFQNNVFDSPIYRATPINDKVQLPRFCINPFPTAKHTARKLEYVLGRQGFTIEFDVFDLEFQKALFNEALPAPTCAVFSGNKSIHFIISFEELLTPEQDKEIVDLLKKAFPFADHGMITNKVALSRVPGGVRQNNGKEQSILAIGSKYPVATILKTLRDYTQNITRVPSKANDTLLVQLRKGTKKVVNIINGKKVSTELQLDEYERHGLCVGLLRDLVYCGYGLQAGSMVYQSLTKLSQYFPENFNLDQEIESAKQDIRTAQINKEIAKDSQRTTNSSQNLREWVHNELLNVDIMSVLSQYLCIEKEHFINDEHSIFACPFPDHADSTPSANTFRAHNGIQYIHCFGCHRTLNALQIAIEYGHLEFLQACQTVFGKVPPTWCRYCGQEIQFKAKKPFNLDDTPHSCQASVCCYCAEPIQWKEKRPYNLDGSEHKCTYHANIADNGAEACDEVVAAIQAQQINLDEFERLQVSQIRDSLEKISEGDVVFLYMPTGAGKTYSMLRQCLKLASLGKQCVFVTGTIRNVTSAVALTKQILHDESKEFDGISEKDLQVVVSNLLEDEEEICKISLNCKVTISSDTKSITKINGKNKKKKEKTSYRKIIITTYGYIGRQGHSSFGYKQWHDMQENRVVFLDEAQNLADIMEVNYPLATIYRHVNNNYHHCETCPRSARKDDCRNCLLVYAKDDPAERTRERQWYSKFKVCNVESHVGYNEAVLWPILAQHPNWQPLLDSQGNNQGNLFLCPLPSQLNRLDRIFVKKEETEAEYVSNLLSTLVNPHLRQERAIDIATKQPLSMQELAQRIEQAKKDDTYDKISEAIKFPRQVCESPRLCGFDSFPFWQFRGMTIEEPESTQQKKKNNLPDDATKTTFYNGAQAIVFATATFPKSLVDHIDILTQNDRFKRIKKICASDIPAQFNITLLTSEKSLSNEKQITLARAILNDADIADSKILLVAGKKHDAKRVDNELAKSHSDFVELFEGRDFMGNKLNHSHCKTEERKIRLTTTYSRSAIMTGENFPSHTIMIVDAEQFIPMAGISSITLGMTQEEIQAAIISEAKAQITQCVGRLFRTTLPLIPGQTIQDNRQIVILIHGLKFQFQLSKEICISNTYNHYHQTWQNQAEVTADAAYLAIKLARQGQKPNDYYQEYLKRLATTKIEKLSAKQRQFVESSEEIQAIKAEIKAEEELKKEAQADMEAWEREVRLAEKEFDRKQRLAEKEAKKQQAFLDKEAKKQQAFLDKEAKKQQAFLDKEAKKQQSVTDKWQKIIEAHKNGASYREICIKFNLARSPELKDKAKQLFDK